MVRAPARSCPNLCRVLEEAPAALASAFLGARAFERLDWLSAFRFDPSDPETGESARTMLWREKKERLAPLEAEATRIVTISRPRGLFALEGLATTKLHADRLKLFGEQRDEIARSLWTYLEEHGLFEAAENSLHLRLYRRYDKHYQTFMIDPSGDSGADRDDKALAALLTDLASKLDRGEGYALDRFDIPADGDEPAAEMYLLFHRVMSESW